MKHIGVVGGAFVVAAGLLLGSDVNAGSLEPPGPPAPTMKTIDEAEPRISIPSLPFTISAPGSYYLTRDLTGVSGASGITITASFVSIDLNGFSLIGAGGSLDGINASTAGTKQIAIRNGVIRGWGRGGISATPVVEATVEDLRVQGNGNTGVSLGSRGVVSRTIATGNAGQGFSLGSSSTVVECTAEGHTVNSGFVVGPDSTVSASVAANNGVYGFQLFDGAVATDCTARGNTTGFSVAAGSRVVHSTARANVEGFSGSDGASIEECTANANTGDGIRVANQVLVRGNVTYLNTGDGIEASGIQNRIEDNETMRNAVGIRAVGAGNLIVRNSAVANPSGEYVIAAGNKLGPISTDPATAGLWANFDL